MNKITRRYFLGAAVAGTAALTLAGQNTAQVANDLRQYEPNLRDRLWMWGHGPGTTDGQYNIPKGNKIDMCPV